MSRDPETFLPYHEPGIVTILVQSSFLLVLNIINTLFDKLIFCGLLGQVFVGVAWGTPGAKWLGVDVEDTVVQLGYLGLILLVYEGGLGTNFKSLKANLFLSVGVAVTGIAFPIAFSFTLLPLVGATPVQAFAAGAALCSTSLGTTFTILSTSGLSATRLGTVLTTAAMLDDVVGLVMVQVISNLGESTGSFNYVTVVRPLAVSVGFAILTPLVCRFVAVPVTWWLNGIRKSNPEGAVEKMCKCDYTSFVVHTITLLGFVTGSTYAGTSNLFAAYLAGASISWWDSEVEHLDVLSIGTASEQSRSPIQQSNLESATISNAENHGISSHPRDEAPGNSESKAVRNENRNGNSLGNVENSGSTIYHKYYGQAVQRILKPFFFASIGFAVPITEMFSGGIFWRGIIYTVLMLFAKSVTGLWLVRLNIPRPTLHIPKALRSFSLETCWKFKTRKRSLKKRGVSHLHELEVRTKPAADRAASTPRNIAASISSSPDSPPLEPTPKKINKPLSLYPASMLGTAMTARGEIGFLIASLAETTGLFASPNSDPDTAHSSEIYLVATWAIVLCTIIGPLSVGTLVKRVRRLQAEREKNPGKADPLGIWGVN